MPSDSDDEALFASLEEEDDTSYRTQRIQQLNAELASQKTNRDISNTGAGASLVHRSSIYTPLDNDQSVLDFTTETSRCVVHFGHAEFSRCGVMDARLEELAGAHHEVRFARVDVRNTPFLVAKLGIKVLPCVIGFKDGVGIDRVVGFEGLGAGGFDGTEGFDVKVLEKRLLRKGVLMQARFSEGDDGDDDDVKEVESESDDGETRRRGGGPPRRAIRSGNTALRGREDDDDDDWD